jgi:hypothetical protein
MQTTLDRPSASPLTISEAEALRAASTYVAIHIDPAFTVVNGTRYYHKLLRREVWQFIIRCPQGPLDAIHIDVQTGTVLPQTDEYVRVIREKAALLVAREQGGLPLNEQGYVLAEYARRRARSYLDTHLSMFYDGIDPVFVPGEPPLWQVTIVFQMYDSGPFMLGVLDVEATTGEPIPLSMKQIKRIRERTRAIIRHQTPATTTG